jgi:hypothetical protein
MAAGLQYKTLFIASRSVVNYPYRTVAEFLMSDNVSKEMHAMTGSSFDPYQNIIFVCPSLIVGTAAQQLRWSRDSADNPV